MRVAVSLLALFIALTPAAVHAANIDAAGAEKLKAAVDDALYFYLAAGKDSETQGLRLSGPITVTPKKDFYEVVLPGTVALSNQGRLSIGNIVINAVPGKDGEYLTSMALPSTLTTLDNKTGEKIAEIKLGTQKFAGAWHPALGTYTKLDAQYKDITLTGSEKQPMNGTLAAFSVTLDLKKDGAGFWSGEQRSIANDVSFATPAAPAAKINNKFSLSKGVLETQYDKVDLAQAQAAREKLKALYKDGRQPTREELKSLMAENSDKGTFFDGMTNKADISGIALEIQSKPHLPAPPAPLVLKADKITSQFNIKGARAEKGTISVNAALNGMTATGLSDEAAGLVPASGTFKADVVNLPVPALTAAITAFITQSMEGDPQKPDETRAVIRAEDATENILKTLVTAGTTLTIKDSRLVARDLSANITGDAKAVAATAPQAAAQSLVVGALVLALEGVDELRAAYEQKAKAGNKNAAAFGQVINVLQVMGQQGKTAAGKSQRSFKLELTPEGRLQMNGADISAMAALLQGMKNTP